MYDPKCYALAIAFLADYKTLTEEQRGVNAEELAQEIQDAIENYLAIYSTDHD